MFKEDQYRYPDFHRRLRHFFSFLVQKKPTQREIDAFCRAAGEGNDMTVELFLDRYGGAIINAKDSIGRTALGCAAGNPAATEKREVIGRLLYSGGDLAATNDDGDTPLMLAARCGEKYTVALFMKAGASVVVKNKFGKSAEAYAEEAGHPEIAALIKATRELRYEIICPPVSNRSPAR